MYVKYDEINSPEKISTGIGNMLLGFAMGVITLFVLWGFTDLLLTIFSNGILRLIDN